MFAQDTVRFKFNAIWECVSLPNQNAHGPILSELPANLAARMEKGSGFVGEISLPLSRVTC